MSRRVITCGCCGRRRARAAHGWCAACYERWRRAGRPADGPPPPPVMYRDVIACGSCGKRRQHCAHGWCSPCYMRWDRAGRPADGPPPARRNTFTPELQARVQERRRAAREDRIAEYRFLLSCGEIRENAAARVGVSLWTAREYEKALVAA